MTPSTQPPVSPSATAPQRIAIVGAGLSGLACAEQLARQGTEVVLFDKARGPGGRLANKRLATGAVDIGAQSFTARDPRFIEALAAWQAAGCAALWPNRAYKASAGGWQPHDDGQQRYTGTPRMSAISRHMAAALADLPSVQLAFATRIVDLNRRTNGWHLTDANGNSHGPFSQVVISAPPPQAEPLVAPWDARLAAACHALPQRSCWAGWVVFAQPFTAPAQHDNTWHTLHTDHPALRMVARNRTKPGREQHAESLTLMAHLDWSEEHLEQTAAVTARQLYQAFVDCWPGASSLPRVAEWGAHRWRYAQPREPGTQSYLYSESGLALCGDSLRGARMEDAWLSGHELGSVLVSS